MSADLAPVAGLAYARAILTDYRPRDADQERIRARMLAFVDEHPGDAHERSCLAGHLTAAAFVLDAARERALLTFHRKLGKWLQFGGHCDGDANLRGVAWRETIEESGIVPTHFSGTPIDLDVHTIPERPGEPEHLHLDTRYLALAHPEALPVVSEESIELGWFTPDEAQALDLDESVRRLFRIAFSL